MEGSTHEVKLGPTVEDCGRSDGDVNKSMPTDTLASVEFNRSEMSRTPLGKLPTSHYIPQI
jgi:hypothetical protein